MIEKLLRLADRTLVLFIGIAVGAVIGMAFLGGGGGHSEAMASAPIAAEAIEQAQAEPAAAECAARFSPQLTRALAEGETVDIGVFGDSFGDGIWAALYRAFRGEEGFEVHRFAQNSVGFTRYRSVDLYEDISEKLAEHPIDIAVLSFGANDTDGLWAEGTAAQYMSEDWQRIVGRRVDAVVQLLRDHGAVVYWVGLPRMRRPEFDAQIRQMNDFYARRMRELGVPYIETASLSVDDGGQYAAYLPDPESGERTLARANDGIHMTGIGYSFLTGGLEARIRDYVTDARAEARREQRRRAARAESREREG